MRGSRAVIVGLILITIAGLAAWVFLKPAEVAEQSDPPAEQASASSNLDVPSTRPAAPPQSAPPPVPETNTTAVATSPQRGTFSQLDARSLAVCHGELLKKKGIESLMGCEKTPVDDRTAQSYCRSYQAELNQRLQKATAGAASCPQELATASGYYDAMRTLAVRGDIPAQRCFIQGYFGTASMEGADSRVTAEQEKEYIELAKKFIDAAFQRGDWSVVRWLGKTKTEVTDVLLFQAYPIGIDNLESLYRMKYPLVLGNQPDVGQSEDARRLTNFWKQNQKLTPQQIAEAEAWAHDMYNQHFNGSQEGASITGANFCELR